MKVKNDLRSKFSNLSNWKEEAWKYQGFNGINFQVKNDHRSKFSNLSNWRMIFAVNLPV